MCGELAGFLEDRRRVRPRVSGSVRFDGRRLTCGRCGSILLPGEEDRSPAIRDVEDSTGS
jgi:RNase P subunit RPR2